MEGRAWEHVYNIDWRTVEGNVGRDRTRNGVGKARNIYKTV